MLGMDMPHAHALFPHSTGPYSARRSGEARATPSVGKIFAPCMIPGTSTQKRGLPGKIRALCIRNALQIAFREYTARRSCHEGDLFAAQTPRIMHDVRILPSLGVSFGCCGRGEGCRRSACGSRTPPLCARRRGAFVISCSFELSPLTRTMLLLLRLLSRETCSLPSRVRCVHSAPPYAR